MRSSLTGLLSTSEGCRSSCSTGFVSYTTDQCLHTHLIPIYSHLFPHAHIGIGILKIDWLYTALRYDGRAHLSDKAMFCLKPNIVRRLVKEEEELEAALDEERYLSLNRDIMEEELMKGESSMHLSASAMSVKCGLQLYHVFLNRSRCHGNVRLNAAPKSHRPRPVLRTGSKICRYAGGKCPGVHLNAAHAARVHMHL